MNPLLCRVVLRDRTPLESLDLAVRFVRETWRPYVILTTVLLLPVWIAAVAVAVGGDLGLWVAGALVLLGPLFQAPFTLLGARLLFAPHVAVRDVLWWVPSTLGPSLAAWAASVLDLMVALISVGMLWPFSRAGLLYLREVMALEGHGLVAATPRTLALATARPGAALLGACIGFVMAVWMPLVTESLGQALVGFVLQLGAPFGSLWSGQVTPYLLAGLLLSHPAIATFRLFLYVDTRTQLEGWDLQNALRAAAKAP